MLKVTVCKVFFTVVLLFKMISSYASNKVNGSDSLNSSIDSLLSSLRLVMDREHIPGLMLSIVNKDSILFSGGLGFSELENKRNVTASTLFHLASITKLFVAIGIQELARQGKLDLNTPLSKIAPEIKFKNKWETTQPVRIIHLLEHTSGFDDIHINRVLNLSVDTLSGLKAVQFVEKSLVSRFSPGKMMSYSNAGYIVLGYIIEQVSGMPWSAYLKQTVLEPIGMNNTTFDLQGKYIPNYAKGYQYINQRFIQLPFYKPGGNGAAGAMVSNATDVSLFLQHILGSADGKNQWFAKENLDELERVHSSTAAHKGLQTGYALGNGIFPNNKKITFRGHNGKGEGFSSWILYNRKVGLGYTISINSNNNLWPVSAVIEDFLTKGMQSPTLNEKSLNYNFIKPFLGYYQIQNTKNDQWAFYKKIFNGISLSWGNNKLIAKRNGASDTLVHVGNGIFRVKGDIIPSIVLGKDRSGKLFFQGYGDAFYEKTNYFLVFLAKAAFCIGLISALLYVLYALLSLILLALKKITLKQALITMVPAIGVILSFFALREISLTDAFSKEVFTSLNATTLFIFLGSLALGVLTLMGILLLYWQWGQITKRWVKIALAANIISLVYIVVLLSVNGLVGIRIWAL